MTSPLDSYKTSLDELSFDEDAKARMTSRLEAATASKHAAQVVEFPASAGRRRPGHRLGLVAAALAAALVVGGGGTVAVAAGVLPNPADVLSDIFGGSPAQTELLDEVGRPIDASATSNGVTVTADAVIGDRSSYTVVYSIAFDDPSVLDGIEADENGTLPLLADATGHVDGTMSGAGSARFFDDDPDDNTIQYAETMGVTTWDGSGIIGRTMRFSMTGIRALGESGRYDKAIASGTWDLKFEMNYVDTTVELASGQTTTWQGSNVTIDGATVSSVGVTVEYTIDRQAGDLGESGRMSDEAQARLDAVIGLPVTVTFADGTTFDATNANTTTHEQDDGTTHVTKTATYDRIVSSDDLVSVTVGDVTIPVSAQ